MGTIESAYSELSYWSGFVKASSSESNSESILKEQQQCQLCSASLEDQVLMTDCCSNQIFESCSESTHESINHCTLCNKSEPVNGTIDNEFQCLMDEQIVELFTKGTQLFSSLSGHDKKN